jgi:hypothetical protein
VLKLTSLLSTSTALHLTFIRTFYFLAFTS